MRTTRDRLSKRAANLGVLAALLIAAPVPGVLLGASAAHAQVDVDVRVDYAPPPLPDYDQPPLPGPDYIWVPGTWAWSDDIQDYYWVPGYWDLPPEEGLMWTPAWWGWDYDAYQYHPGYWGYQVGWYGGIDYGYGYHGHGWDGGRWDHGHVAYNRAVINVTNVRVNNVYYAPVNRGPNGGNRVSYNGGRGGVMAQPRPDDMRAMQGQHFAPTNAQQQRAQQAAGNPRAAASRITPGWSPSSVHRMDNAGAPARGGGPGMPQQNQQGYQQQRSYQAAPTTAPRSYQPAPGQGYYGQAPRPAQQQATPGYPRTAPQQSAPPQPNHQQPNYQQHAQPAPNYGHAAPPQPQFHATPPPPAPHTAPPAPRPAPPAQPRPQAPHNDKDHHP